MRQETHVIVVALAVTFFLGLDARAENEQTSDETLVAVIEEIVVEWVDGSECGHVCTDSRREDAPDRSAYVMPRHEAREFGESIVRASETYGVAVEDYLAAAWHETRFKRWAVGSGGECGLFQQLPRYMRPESVRTELDSYETRCDWLQDIANSVLAFSLNARNKIDRFGDAWSCAYNQGSSTLERSEEGWTCSIDGQDYRDRHEMLARRFGREIERRLAIAPMGSS